VWGGPQPLLFQAALSPISLLDNSLFHIHILGHPADGAGVLGTSLKLGSLTRRPGGARAV
jgi:hypothetical protein